MSPQPIPVLILLGPTASGKTRLGVQLAVRFNGEIVSADSRQVYRGLNLGAGKDLQEYETEGGRIPHHLIDIADLSEEYAVFHFQRDALAALEAIRSRGRLPIVVGGSGLYLEALLKGHALNPVPENPTLRADLAGLGEPVLIERLRRLKGKLHNTTDTSDRLRLVRAIEIAEYDREHPPRRLAPLNALLLGVRYPRETLRQHIRERLKARLQAGMLEEVDALLARGVPAERLLRLGLEYRFAVEYRQGRFASEADFFEKLYLAICDFAKRQETWFRRMERQGARIHWLEGNNLQAAEQVVKPWLFPGVPLTQANR